MSSRRLLVLLRHAPEDGPYMTALRDHDWPLSTLILKELHKEVALGRASRYVGTPHEYEPQVFVSPPEALARANEAAAEQDFQERAFGGLLNNIFGNNDDEG